ncbi:MAG TPA: hypothetical protein VNW97_00455 [Candidatus Saccharimonadales bacterium]|jgi:hypothetical protein|nr:hypothetical protein [Candidatus Saccharimonadales bacterium]
MNALSWVFKSDLARTPGNSFLNEERLALAAEAWMNDAVTAL